MIIRLLIICFVFEIWSSTLIAQIPNPVHAGSIIRINGQAEINGAQSVFVQGNYAYVTGYSSTRLEIIDISNPTNPIHKSNITAGNNPKAVQISGNYAYVIDNFSDRFFVFDISNKSNPVLKATINTDISNGIYLVDPTDLFISGNYIYILDSGHGKLTIFDISNPLVPVHKSSVSIGSSPRSIHIQGNYAYIGSNKSFQILDITNSTTPSSIASISDSGFGDTIIDPLAVQVSGDYAYLLNGSIYRSGNIIGCSLEILDVSNPYNISYKGKIIDGDGGSLLNYPSSISIVGNYAYITSQSSNALEIIDISNSSSPTHKTSIVNGANGALLNSPRKVFISGNYAYVASAGSNAMEVIDLFTPPSPNASTATSIGQTSFVANWNATTNATSYKIEVSSDNFSTFVTGYNGSSQSATSVIVTGLSPATNYKYRIRGINTYSASSTNSNIINVVTIPGTPTATSPTNISQTGFTVNWNT
ncbi:MAG TPA: fibronectin type III domain-containing protein, partial [Cyclobacteriaceae bacterium]